MIILEDCQDISEGWHRLNAVREAFQFTTVAASRDRLAEFTKDVSTIFATGIGLACATESRATRMYGHGVACNA